MLKSRCWVDFMPDPFAGVASHAGEQNPINDTRAFCRLYYDQLKQGAYPNGAIQPGDPQLLNVCTYPSSSPTSNQKDCVVTAGSGFLVVNKWTNQASNCSTYAAIGLACGVNNPETNYVLYYCTGVPKVSWNFTYTSGTTTKTSSVYGWGWTPLVILAANTYSVKEQPTLPTGWVQIGFRCVDNQTNPNAVVISSGQTLVCYYVNFYGTVAQFVAAYGNFSNGSSTIVLDQYVPPRTFAPTPLTPTPACPTSVDPFFRACQDSDFVTNCTSACTLASNNLAADFALTTVAFQDRCIGDFNTINGLILTVTTMNIISSRITSAQPVCINGNTIRSLAPTATASSAYPVAASAFLVLLSFFH